MDNIDPARKPLQMDNSPPPRRLADALANLKEWMDGSFDDDRKLFAAVNDLIGRVESIERRLDALEKH